MPGLPRVLVEGRPNPQVAQKPELLRRTAKEWRRAGNTFLETRPGCTFESDAARSAFARRVAMAMPPAQRQIPFIAFL